MRFRYSASTALALTILLSIRLITPDSELAADGSEAQDPVDSIEVRIDIGEDGEPLRLPIALDLGLGFPLWLQPTEQETSEALLFGARANTGPASAEIPPGSSATFRFDVTDNSDADLLQFTPQLFDGVRLSDISRLGFSGFGDSNWQLKSYEVKVNDEIVAANESVALRPHELKEDLTFQLADLDLKLGPLKDQISDLRTFHEVGLASEEDLEQLKELEQEFRDLTTQNHWILGQLDGTYPWFQDSSFEPRRRNDARIVSATVQLVTATHSGADTHNYVYFRTGGHKYVLNRSNTRIQNENGAQTFELDLQAGPLTAADLRGFAVGMLGAPDPFAEAPDRWHPQRMLVMIDGQYVYDSDESPIDRESLKAVRVIPPTHFNAQHTLVQNKPTDRECFLWQAGQGVGLDLFAGGMLPLPPPDADDYPKPEPDPGIADLSSPDPGSLADAGGGDSGDLFPGECCGGGGFIPDTGGNGAGPGNGGWNDPGGNWPGPGGNGWNGPGGGWGSAGGPPPWVGWLAWLLHELGHLPPGTNPPPFGTPIQVKDVTTVKAWNLGDEAVVSWSVTGDESTVDHYVVQMVRVRPDQVDAFPAAEVLTLGTAAPGSRELKGTVAPALVMPGELLFYAPRVVAIPVDPVVSPNQQTGPARAVFPNATTGSDPQWLIDPDFGVLSANVADKGQVTAGTPQDNVSRAIWVAGEVESHNGILFDNLFDNLTLTFTTAARPEPGDTEMQFAFGSHGYNGRYNISAHVGFLGTAAAGNKVDVEMQCVLLSPDPANPSHFLTPVSVTVTDPAGGPPDPMQVIQQVVDSKDASFSGGLLVVKFTLKTDAVDPQHPPVLLGITAVKTP